MSNHNLMLKKIFNNFPQKSQFKFIFLFISISFSLWIFTKLSDKQTAKISFPVEFINTPDLIIVEEETENNVNLTLTSSGFDLILYSFKNAIQLNLSLATYNSGNGLIDLSKQNFQIQKQLFEGTIINEIYPPVLNFDYSKLSRKKVRVSANDDLKFMSGYNKFSDWDIEPDSILVSGPISIIDTLKHIPTNVINYYNVNSDINEFVELSKIHPLLEYNRKFVDINLSVKKYTEKTLSSPINIINLPDSLSIRLFPQILEVSFIIPIESAESVNSNDFYFFCDYLDSDFGNKDILIIKLLEKPEMTARVKWEPKYVNYLIRK